MKKILASAVAAFFASLVFAYNPPIAGENIYKLTNPTLLGGGASATGGPFGDVVVGSIAYNPALSAMEQRTAINASASFLIDGSGSSSSIGWGFQGGAIIPNKWMVFTAAAEGLFTQGTSLDLGNNITAHFGFAKEMNENISVGLNAYFGYYFGSGYDFVIGADLGFLYSLERLGFMRDVRIGFSLLNMGKPLSGTYPVTGIYGDASETSFPGIFTPRLSFAAELFSVGTFNHKFSGSFSIDGYFPTFQNAVCDLAFGLSYNRIINLTVGWEANAREIAQTNKVNGVSVGLGVHLVISSGDTTETREQNEIIPAAAWQNLCGNVHDLSVGATVYFGMTDDEAPEVYLWGEQLTFEESGE